MSSLNSIRGAVVTGGARGIGFATARRLASQGAGVLILDRDADAAGQAAHELTAEGFKSWAVVGDVVSRSDVQAAIKACIEMFGGLDVMVSNAGLADVTPLLDITDDSWERVLDVNLTGAFRCTQEAARAMVADRGGSVVIVSSTNGFHPEQNLGGYNAAKGGVINFVRSAALDLGRRGVRVNGVAPGFVKTRGAGWMIDDPELGPAYLKTIPLGRYAEPEDIADVIAFLASNDARHMTGQTLVVDGGHTLGVPLPDLHVDSPWREGR